MIILVYFLILTHIKDFEQVLRFGDNPVAHRDTYDPTKKDVTLLLYLNPSWHLNFAGETVYFDEQGEIELAVLPKFRRLGMHEGYINFFELP